MRTVENRKINSIQVVRFFAFLLIFLSHYPFVEINTSYLGAFGTSIFIILSGYLTVFKQNNDSYRKAVSRVAKKIEKLFPLHFVTFLLSIPISGLFSVLSGKYSPIKYLLKAIINLSMTQAYFPAQEIYFSFNGVSWYLTLVILFAALSKPLLFYVSKLYHKIGFANGIIILYLLQIVWLFFTRNSAIEHWLIYI